MKTIVWHDLRDLFLTVANSVDNAGGRLMYSSGALEIPEKDVAYAQGELEYAAEQLKALTETLSALPGWEKPIQVKSKNAKG